MLSLTWLFLRLLAARPGSGAIILLGAAGFAGIVLFLFAMADGFEQALMTTGEADRALLLRSGSTSEINGNNPLQHFPIVRDLPQIQVLNDVGLASRETYVTVKMPTIERSRESTLVMRGVTDAAYAVRDEVELLAGRAFTPGKHELIAGIKAAQQFADLHIGSVVQLRGQSYRVTGHFSAEHGATESEVWVDERLLAQALGRGDTFSSMLVRLQGVDQFEEFRQRVADDRRLALAVFRERDFYADLAAPTVGLMRGLSWLIGVIMLLGAVAAAINSMQSALDSRTREIATLRTLGFRRGPLLGAVLIEATVLSLSGVSLAVLGLYLGLHGQTFSTVAAATTSGAQVAFELALNGRTMAIAVTSGLCLGVIGGLFPSLGTLSKRLPLALRG